MLASFSHIQACKSFNGLFHWMCTPPSPIDELGMSSGLHISFLDFFRGYISNHACSGWNTQHHKSLRLFQHVISKLLSTGLRGRPSKRKLPSMEELISKSKGFLKKKHKPRHYEFGTDPVTGRRNNKGTYSGTPQRQPKKSCTSSAEIFELDVNEGKICLPCLFCLLSNRCTDNITTCQEQKWQSRWFGNLAVK